MKATGRKTKISIAIRLGGIELTKIELSPLEYEEIRLLPPRVAIEHIIKKDPELGGNELLRSLIIRSITAGRYEIREA